MFYARAMTCNWDLALGACCLDAGLSRTNPGEEAKIDGIIAQVSAMMTRWSGYRFGGCRTVRPLDPCGECREGCCAQGDAIVLHDASKVLEVRLDGEKLPDTAYTFAPARGVLYRTGGLRWPTRDIRSASPPALEVDIQIGEDPDAWALTVAAELACELLLDAGNKKCRLPKNATTITSQGVTVTIPESELQYLIPSVAAWVSAHNPLQTSRPARVFSPEGTKARVLGNNSGRGWRRFPWR